MDRHEYLLSLLEAANKVGLEVSTISDSEGKIAVLVIGDESYLDEFFSGYDSKEIH